MAVDTLVDKTKLNNSLSYEADRIRLKTGGSADIAFDFANEKGFGDAIDAIPSGGGDPVLGLLWTATITEPVATMEFSLSDAALSYGVIKVVCENVVLSANDYFYAAVTDENSSPNDASGYRGMVTTISQTAHCVFRAPYTANGITMNGYSGTAWGTGGGNGDRIMSSSSFTPKKLKIKLYQASTRINSGTISVYGRLS